MKILLLGGGGREHVLAWKLNLSPICDDLFISPGNAGTAHQGTNIRLDSFEEIKNFCKDGNIDMLVIGPETPLVDGLVDEIKADPALIRLHVIGPNAEGARLEGSKDFAKDFMKRHGIPTADSRTFTTENISEAQAYLNSLGSPFVLKADGLAAGKGVLIEPELKTALRLLDEIILEKKFGAAGSKVVVEQFLEGIELSVFVLTDGKNYITLPEAKDYKRIGEGDTGLNTGGMGAISPVAFANSEFMQKVDSRIVQPTIQGLLNDDLSYSGFIFLGLMNIKGDPFIIEYNCRLGDPEAEVVLPRIKNDLVEIFLKTSEGKLDECKIEVDDKAATTVMLVSGGYPESYQKGKMIKNLEGLKNVLPFHAGTGLDENGIVVTTGGRVMAITALGDSVNEALSLSKSGAELVEFDNKYYRKDIGFDLLSFSYE
jgi:phosphoribosylamine---glycine ligase